MEKLNQLPKEIQEEVKNTLKAYDEVNVWFEYGRYYTECGACIKSNYGADHRFVGTYKASEVFTPEERILNYISEFRCYPIEYKGKRDYGWLKALNYGDKLKFDSNGDVVNA